MRPGEQPGGVNPVRADAVGPGPGELSDVGHESPSSSRLEVAWPNASHSYRPGGKHAHGNEK